MSRFTLTPHERSVASICTILCVEWQFPEERMTLLGILKEGLPHCRQQVPVLDLVVRLNSLLRPRRMSSSPRHGMQRAALFQPCFGQMWSCAKLRRCADGGV